MKMESIESEFTKFCITSGKGYGLDSLSSKLFSIIYLESSEIALDQLAKITGYSLASVSNKMRLLESFGMVQRIKKPGSKKVFYYMEKDVIKLTKMHFEKIIQAEIEPAKQMMPELITKFKTKKLNKKDKTKLGIIKNYYKQMLGVEEIMIDMIQKLDKLK
ncbi:hypothetical protein HN789_07715 [archaeon]|jgi:HTH-type transcriptional regulator, osmoprotectant uptake regulator|nr:hypothetical protein [archaeon]MBT4858023.1 hypothetical protein [archaeon]MBT5424231.1 hypothetical protein [archaeon]MBT7441104.1 hypothetical protein [archaeon]